MQLRIKFLTVLLLTVFIGLFSAKTASASTFTLSGKVTDNSNTGVANATVDVNNASDNTNVATTTTDSGGNYTVSIDNGTYNIQVTPPSGSNLSPIVALSQTISADKVLNFVVVPSGNVVLSGHIYDSLGNPASGVTVALKVNNNLVAQATSDSSGSYSVPQVSSGSYLLSYSGSSNTTNLPPIFEFHVIGYSLNQSKILDITIPAKKVTVHTQDSSANPLTNVQLKTNNANGNISSSIGGGITNSSGSSGYTTGTFPVTDSSGNAILWLLPLSNAYTLTATPPTGSGYLVTNSSVTISSDTNLTVAFQQPVTLSGHVYDSLNNPASGVTVALKTNGGNTLVAQTTTDSSGNYSVPAVSPGNYFLSYSGSANTSNLPPTFEVHVISYSLTQDTALDVTVPVKKISVHAQDAAGNPISNVQIKTNQVSASSLTIATNVNNGSGSSGYLTGTLPVTDSSGNAILWLLPAASAYTITATPPSGSGYLTASSSVTVSADTNVTFNLHQPVSLSGHIYDPLGNPAHGVTIALKVNNSVVAQTTSDASGTYSVPQVSSGTYFLSISGGSNTVNLPPVFEVHAISYVLNQNTSLDVTIPTKKISVHIQDALGNPVNNVQLNTNNNFGNISSIGANLTSGSSAYLSGTLPTTNSSGDTVLWLLPLSNAYTITATPPSGSIYNTFNLTNLSVTSDQSELISLQYSHAAPITTATLSPVQNSDGTYPNPVSVSLSATAASGYTVAHTYYTIDGGTQQTYSAAFNVSGNGSHTIHYWSDDNSGVTEIQNTKTFTIAATYSLSGTVYVDSNQNGFQDTGEAGYSGAIVSLNGGQTATTDSSGNYSFTNLPAATYTETVTLPNGYSATTTNPATVALSADTTENLGITQANSLVLAINTGGDAQGNFVADTDATGGSTYSSSNTVDTSNVTNPAPQAVYQTVRYGNFSYVIPNLNANSAYTLRLHFNELYWGTSMSGNSGGDGSRVFNVLVNGAQVLSNYDIYHNAGGANKAIVEQIPATADADGKVTIQFTTVTDSAMVNGIEVYSGTLPSPTPTATPTPVTSLAIDSGGTTQGSFVADKDFIGGTVYTSTASVDTTGVTNPAPESVYQSVRYGNMNYTIPNLAPNSSYTVRLHFNELYWGTALSGNTGGVGSRVFNVSINSTQVLNNFDIFQEAGGANIALVKNFTAISDANGKIIINFNSVSENAMINGIEVFQ